MFDAEIMGAGLAEIVRGEIEAATKAMAAEIADLRRQLSERPEATPLESIQRMIADAVRDLPPPEVVLTDDLLNTIDATANEAARLGVETALAALPAPKDGDPGKDADPAVIRQMIDEALATLAPTLKGEPGKDADPDAIDLIIAQAIARLPVPTDGKSVTVEDVAPLIDAAVQKAVAALPTPKDGADGVGLAAALIDKDGQLVVTNTKGEAFALGPVVGRDGIDAKGEPGRDGFSLTDFSAELSEDGRTLVLAFESEEVRVTHQLEIGAMAYRGAYREGQEYRKGDMTFFAGSLWHCDQPTIGKPGIDEAWSMAAKRGRDGKAAVGIVDAKVDTEGHLVLTMSDATTKDCGKVRGRDGKDAGR